MEGSKFTSRSSAGRLSRRLRGQIFERIYLFEEMPEPVERTSGAR